MAFIEKKDPVVLNIRLTTKGRELLSTGNLNFKYFAIGDSEIDYGFNRETGLKPFDSRILRPADNNPNLLSFITSISSGDSYNVIPSIPTSTYLVTNTADSIGFFYNISGNSFTFNTDPNHVKQAGCMIYMSGVTGGSTVQLKQSSAYIPPNEPAVGDLILVKWTLNDDTTPFVTLTNKPTPFLIYQIVSKTGTLASNSLVINVDRELPDFTSYTPTGRAGVIVYYNLINYTGNTISAEFATDYLDESVLDFFQNSQCPTVIFPFWNMSIIFTEEIAGVKSAIAGGNNKTFGQFNTAAYGGFVSYIQSQAPKYKKLGVIHYTNSSPANVYGEGFYQNTAVLDIPTIMWHKSSGSTKLGAKFVAGSGFTLVNLGIHYYDLVDVTNKNVVVGKMFDELKMFLIEDQELLFAMSYKSNRSWTLPAFTLAGGGSGGCVPVPETPETLFVQTIIGQPGSIKNTGGYNIIGWESVTEYGMEYKLADDANATWIRISGGTKLTSNSFSMNILDTLPNTTYNYRAYVKMGNNEYIDNSNNNKPITTLSAPVIPPTPPVIIPSVLTTVGTAGIGQITSTGGNSIPANVFIAIEKYGMEYKQSSLGDIPANWTLSSAAALSGPLTVNNFTLNLTGLAQSTSYDYRAYIQVGGVIYRSGSYQTTVTTATPVPQIFTPQVTTGILWKQLSVGQGIDVITKTNSINDKGGAAITEYGILYTQSPDYSSPAALVYGGTGVGKVSIVGDYGDITLPFTMTMNDLSDSSPIYFRVFAQNSAGIGYGSVVNGMTIPIAIVPPARTIFICGATTPANPLVTSAISAKIGVSTPLQAGESVILHLTDCAVSDTVSGNNQMLIANIRAESYYTLGASTTKNNLASSNIPIGITDTCSCEVYTTLTVTADNIDSICLHANAYSTSKNSSYNYTNMASVNIIDIENAGGANYQVGANTLQAYNTSTGGGTGGGGGLLAPV